MYCNKTKVLHKGHQIVNVTIILLSCDNAKSPVMDKVTCFSDVLCVLFDTLLAFGELPHM